MEVKDFILNISVLNLLNGYRIFLYIEVFWCYLFGVYINIKFGKLNVVFRMGNI